MIPIKLILFGFGALTIVTTLGLHYLADNKRIAAISQLETDKALLVASNESLEKDLEYKEKEIAQIVRESIRIKNSEDSAQKEMAKLRNTLTSKERKDRVDAIRQGKKDALLLRLANKQANCEWEYFDRFDGKCIGGKWKDE